MTTEGETDEPRDPSETVPATYELDSEDDLSDTELRLLLRDHESAGTDARYRDRLIHTGFYLSLIFAGILLDTGVRLLGQERFLLLSAVAGFGAVAYYVLWVWTESFTGARNAAWNRRRQIEYELNAAYPGHLKGHVDVFDRLTFTDGDGFEHAGRSGREEQSAGDLTQFLIKFEFSSAAVISCLAFWYGTSIRFGSPLVGTALTVPVFVIVPVTIVKIGLGEGWKSTLETIYEWLTP